MENITEKMIQKLFSKIYKRIGTFLKYHMLMLKYDANYRIYLEFFFLISTGNKKRKAVFQEQVKLLALYMKIFEYFKC